MSFSSAKPVDGLWPSNSRERRRIKQVILILMFAAIANKICCKCEYMPNITGVSYRRKETLHSDTGLCAEGVAILFLTPAMSVILELARRLLCSFSQEAHRA
ncbi:hypothetical protein ACVDG5_000340 [Mesorhizobium sp. ORM6]